MNILGKRSDLPFSRKCDRKKNKTRFPLRMRRILFAAKHSRPALRMGRPLFLGAYLQKNWHRMTIIVILGYTYGIFLT